MGKIPRSILEGVRLRTMAAKRGLDLGGLAGGTARVSKVVRGSLLKGAGILGATGLAAEFLPGLVEGAATDFNIGGKADRDLHDYTEVSRSLNAYARMQQSRQLRYQRLVAQNSELLARHAPDLYNQIMAGQALPPKAVVLGGQPRVDLLDQVAASMAAGKYRGE